MNATVIAETVRRHLKSIGYLAYVALLGIIAAGLSQVEKPATFWPSLVALLAFAAGAAVIGPEFSSGSLQLILVKPIHRAAYLVSRVAGVVLSVWIAAVVAVAAEAVGRAFSGAVPWAALFDALAMSAIDAILIVSLLALFGSLTRGYTNAALYFGIQIALVVFLAITRGKLPASITKAVGFIQGNLYPDTPYTINREWLLLVLTNAAIALVLATLAFRRREVPYGAD
jgi:ABC-type transport system involved in multi-copper enzyme maturation permease subunit